MFHTDYVTDNTYDIVWDDYDKELRSYSPSNKWNKIRGYNETSSYVAVIESEIEYYKGVLNEFLPYKKDEYFNYKELVINSIIVGGPKKIKGITSAYSKILEIEQIFQSNLEYVLKAEENFGEKERAWIDFMKWGQNGFLNDFMHDLECVDGFEDSEYYNEGIFIIKKFKLVR